MAEERYAERQSSPSWASAFNIGHSLGISSPPFHRMFVVDFRLSALIPVPSSARSKM